MAATKPYKAIVAFALSFIGLIVQALVDAGDAAITTREWFVIVLGALVISGGTYLVTNPPTTRTPI